MICAYCNNKLVKEDFPVSHYARCWTCWLEDQDPKVVEAVRRGLHKLELRKGGVGEP